MGQDSRDSVEADEKQKPVKVIAVASGKGGVGKTSVVSNLGIAFAREDVRVLVMDGDLGLANLDIAYGVTPDLTMLDLFDGTATIEEILTDVGEGVTLLPGCSGRYDLANLSDRERFTLFAAVDTLENQFDILLIDTSAGITSNAVAFAGAAQTLIVIADPDPTSLADAYAFMKVATIECGVKHIKLIANRVHSAKEGEQVYRRLSSMVNRFLGIGLEYLGFVNQDNAVSRSTRSRVPVMIGEPKSLAAQRIRTLARKLMAEPTALPEAGGIRLFWKRLVGWKEAS